MNKNARERGESEFENELTVVIVRVILIGIIMDFLIDGQISSFCPGHHGGWLLTLIMQRKLTQSL